MSASKKTEKLVLLGIFSAMSFVLFLFEFPIIPGVEHLKIDLSDFPALVGAVFFGPGFGVTVELFKNVIEFIFKGTATQMGFGNIMNFIVGCGFVVPFSLIFRKFAVGKNIADKKRITVAVIGGIAGVISIIILGIAANYFIAPLYFKYFLGVALTKDMLWAAVWGATAINAVKGIMLAVAGYPLMVVLSRSAGKIFSFNS